jgi:hypothetical protein
MQPSVDCDVSTSRAATDPRLDMVTALQARGPHPSLADRAKVLDRVIGTWDVEYTDFSKDGKVTHRSGEFIVGWVMDGRAIQDFGIVYPSGATIGSCSIPETGGKSSPLTAARPGA